jgi:hypothetical protein
MTRKVIALSAAVLLATTMTARADVGGAGTTGASFLSVGTGTGVLGMGGATLGLGNDLNSISWNVASLGWMRDTQFSLAHASLPDQTSQEWLAYGGRFGRSATRWSLSGLYQSDGMFQGRDAANNPTSDFNVASMALGAQVAYPFGRFVTLGLGSKFVNEKLGPVSGSGLTFDAGLQLRAGLLGFGVAAQNISGGMSYGGARYPFPTNVGVGLALHDIGHGLRLALDANFPSSYYQDVRGGVEWGWRDRFALRTGYRRELGAPASETMTGPSFGMGAGAHGVWLDYSYLVPGSGDGQHRMGFTFRPGSLGMLGAPGRSDSPSPASGPERAPSTIRADRDAARQARELERAKSAEAARNAKAMAETQRAQAKAAERDAKALESAQRAQAKEDARTARMKTSEATAPAMPKKVETQAAKPPKAEETKSSVVTPAAPPTASDPKPSPSSDRVKPAETSKPPAAEASKAMTSSAGDKQALGKPKSKKELEALKKKALEDARKAVEGWRKE